MVYSICMVPWKCKLIIMIVNENNGHYGCNNVNKSKPATKRQNNEEVLERHFLCHLFRFNFFGKCSTFHEMFANRRHTSQKLQYKNFDTVMNEPFASAY